MPGITVAFKFTTGKLKQYMDELPDRADDLTHSAAREVIELIRSRWSPSSPSAPGQPPAVVTGALAASIRLRQIRGGYMPVYRVYAEKSYGKWLEEGTRKMYPRPFLAPAAYIAFRNIRENARVKFKP